MSDQVPSVSTYSRIVRLFPGKSKLFTFCDFSRLCICDASNRVSDQVRAAFTYTRIILEIFEFSRVSAILTVSILNKFPTEIINFLVYSASLASSRKVKNY